MPSLVAERSVLKTPPSAEPLTVAELKSHLRVTHSRDDDYIESLGKAARRQLEHVTGRALITQSWYLYLDEWPDDDRVRLPYAPLTTVSAVTYKDTDGTETTWSSSNYIVDTNPVPGELVLKYGLQWPNGALYPASPIKIDYTAGYGSAGTAVPEDLLDGIRLMVGQRYPVREGPDSMTVPSWIVARYQVEMWR